MLASTVECVTQIKELKGHSGFGGIIIAGTVAQISNLLYRRLPTCWPQPKLDGLGNAGGFAD
jgi:hypothetical protein